MDNWRATFLGLKQLPLPRELTAFEIEAFFAFALAERQLIEDRCRPTLKLGLSLQIGFLRTSGRLLAGDQRHQDRSEHHADRQSQRMVLSITLIPAISSNPASSPLTFGAVGDRVTDNTTAIQSAVNAGTTPTVAATPPQKGQIACSAQ